MMDFLASQPEWAQYLVRGVLLFVLMACSAVALSRAGRSPYWAVLLIVPYVFIVAVWVFAFCRWPRVDGKGAA